MSDNATAFTSSEFSDFLKRNDIRHILTPPYHPASNGSVERSVQTFKEGLKRLKKGSLNTRLMRFLFKCRITPHSSTGVSPAELMYGRKLRSQLDLLKPSPTEVADKTQNRQETTTRSFNVGDCVYARNYSRGPKWLPGQVVQVEGSVLYQVKLKDGRVQRRHINQLRSRVADSEDAVQSSDPEPDSGLQLTEGGPTDQETVTTSQDLSPDPPTDSTDSPEPEITTELQPAEPRPDELVSNSELSRDTMQEASEESSEPETESQPTALRRSARTKQQPLRYDDLMY